MTSINKRLTQATAGYLKAITAFCAFMLITLATNAAQDLFWMAASGTTSSWFTVNNWNDGANASGSGSSYLPTATNFVRLDGGVCVIDAGSNTVVSGLGNKAYWQNATGGYTLNIEAGATLTSSNQFQIGNYDVDGTVNVKGTLKIPNVVNNGFNLAGYADTHTNCIGVLNIDGGKVISGDISSAYNVLVGGASTGRVEITNGGIFHNYAGTTIGYGLTSQSDGSVIIQDGAWTNEKSIVVGSSLGRGSITINGGTLANMLTDVGALKIGNTGYGRFEINGGSYIGRSAFNSTNSNANRANIAIGYSSGSTGIFIQNGGTVDAVGLNIGENGGTGTAIISNGVFNAMSNNGSWPCFNIYNGSKLTIDGGDFLAYTNGNGHVRSGGILELKSGTFDLNNGVFYTYSNAIVRLVGPLANVTAWWRPDSGDPSNSVMELVLTKDPGHIATFKSIRTASTAVPGTLRVGFDGGACMLSTNTFAYLWASTSFDNTRAQVSNYNLDLWDASEVSLGTGNGEEHRIALKATASKGSANLPASEISFADTAYGYIAVSNLNSGTLPEMEVNLTITPAAKTAAQIVQDLQTAGYTNSVATSTTTINMVISDTYITTDSAYFAWDFRETDGTVNATVNTVSFKFSPKGTVILIK